MPRIKQLSPLEAQKIAAGEVVERPANVVKELVENSLDAGATKITIYLEDGGKESIRVVDNGCGMAPEDARLSILQHATSKISSVDDLKTIKTFGFRGEALASISSVSHTTLISKEADSLEGIQLTVQDGSIAKEEMVSATTGTDITIRNLFYNVPARKKFLKKTETELNQIHQLINAFCLMHRNVHFKVFHNDRLLINCAPIDDLIIRFSQLWDHTFNQHLIRLEENSSKQISLEGAISNHHAYRYDRSTIFIFVNNRWIKNYALSKALIKGYMNVLPPNRYPSACINITIPHEHVDINIHPRKEEVQFLHPRIVESQLQETIKKTLEGYVSSRLSSYVKTTADRPSFAEASFFASTTEEKLSMNSATQDMTADKPSFVETTADKPSLFEMSDPFVPYLSKPNNIFTLDHQGEVGSSTQFPVSIKNTSEVELHSLESPYNEPNTNLPATESTPYTLIGQCNKTYLLLEQEDGLFLIDQHAAHERILYEEFSKRFESIATVQLLFPQIISLSPTDIECLLPHLNFFQINGIILDQFSETELVIHSVPVHMKDQSIQDLVHQLIGWITEHAHVDENAFKKTIHEKLRAQMACKAAVKAGDILTREHMEQLISTLHQTDNRLTCPHGRPTGWLLSLYEIEKKFKRKL